MFYVPFSPTICGKTRLNIAQKAQISALVNGGLDNAEIAMRPSRRM